MEIITAPAEMTAWSREASGAGQAIALVPTMGFFHEGHLSLMRRAAELGDRVVVSLFVNPMQFGPREDFAAYPRDLERDRSMAEREGVAVMFAPEPADMYPEGFLTSVSVRHITRHLCGASRPGHFDGVATVLTKLFLITRADIAVFGEKDFQQLAVIRRMVADLNMNIRIVGYPTVREEDGLAMSSRNEYLRENERESALSLYRAICLARGRVQDGERAPEVLLDLVRDHILSHAGTEIDYASLVDADTLEPCTAVDSRSVLVLAVKINGRVRLIDNGYVASPAAA